MKLSRSTIVLLAVALVVATTLAPGRAAQAPQAQATVRFTAMDVLLDVGDTPVAAYQIHVTTSAGDVTLVGIEGGEHAAFRQPPYYDPKAMGQNRIVLGAFNTGSDLPRGRTRVARLMVRVTGDTPPAYAATVQVAASPDGKPIPNAAVSLTESEGADQ